MNIFLRLGAVTLGHSKTPKSHKDATVNDPVDGPRAAPGKRQLLAVSDHCLGYVGRGHLHVTAALAPVRLIVVS